MKPSVDGGAIVGSECGMLGNDAPDTSATMSCDAAVTP
ncbi:Uncharacterised protein [Mycobacterium tuberculosis]|nr:Uncharacterised protein [Mycobacterium tuberculosis]